MSTSDWFRSAAILFNRFSTSNTFCNAVSSTNAAKLSKSFGSRFSSNVDAHSSVLKPYWMVKRGRARMNSRQQYLNIKVLISMSSTKPKEKQKTHNILKQFFSARWTTGKYDAFGIQMFKNWLYHRGIGIWQWRWWNGAQKLSSLLLNETSETDWWFEVIPICVSSSDKKDIESILLFNYCELATGEQTLLWS